MNRGKIIRFTLLTLFAAVFCYSAVRLIGIWTTYSRNERIYEEAIDQFLIDLHPEETVEPSAAPATGRPTEPPRTDAAPDGETTAETAGETTAEPSLPLAPDFAPDWAALRAVNPDIVGWIWQSGTTINYPLLKGADNEKYLKTTYNNQSSRLGSIFLDYRSSLSGRNAVIYGHNAGNGMMFATLVKYRNRAYYDENPYFYIITEAGTEKYQIFSVYQVTTDSDTYTFSFDSDAAYEAYLRAVQMRSAYNTGVTVGVDDEVVTLSTCTNTGEEIRFVVHAKRIEG